MSLKRKGQTPSHQISVQTSKASILIHIALKEKFPEFSIFINITDLLRTVCNAGSYRCSPGVCRQCPVGTWSEAGKKSCLPCPAGQYAYKHLSCKNCPPGKYSAEKWDACKTCDVGKVSQRKSSSCTSCLAGQYASKKDNKCKMCAKNTYSKGLVDSCTTCPIGSYSGIGEKECHTCNPGETFDMILKACVKCAASYYSSNPSMACIKCPAGQYSNAGATVCSTCPSWLPVNDAQTDCTVNPRTCPQGQYFDIPNKNCVTCPPGFYTIDQNKPCQACPYQYYTPPNAVFEMPLGTCKQCNLVMTPDKKECVKCPASYFIQKDDLKLTPSKCVKCPPRYYTYIGDETKCDYCDPQYKINDEQTDCNKEYFTPPPTSIPTGSPRCYDGQNPVPISPENPTGCEFCQGGYYSPHPLTPCMQCIGNQYSLIGAPVCEECYKGTIASPDHTYCIIVPTTQPTPAPSSIPTVFNSRCDYGQFDDPILDACVDCLPGFYSPYPTTPCMRCPPNTYSFASKTSVCRPCSYVVDSSSTECSPCPASYTIIPAIDVPGLARICQKCAIGWYSKYNDVCYGCDTGYTANAEQTECVLMTPAMKPTGSPSATCRPGQYRDINIESSICLSCLPSFYQSAPDLPCIKCPMGYYTINYGEITCYQCPAGTMVAPTQDKCISPP